MKKQKDFMDIAEQNDHEQKMKDQFEKAAFIAIVCFVVSVVLLLGALIVLLSKTML